MRGGRWLKQEQIVIQDLQPRQRDSKGPIETGTVVVRMPVYTHFYLYKMFHVKHCMYI
jgi:hypothetical protein